MLNYHTTKICPNFKEIEVEVEYYYEPAEAAVWTYANGDPGHPGSPAVVEIQSIKHNGVDIYDYLHDSILDKLQEEILNYKPEIYY